MLLTCLYPLVLLLFKSLAYLPAHESNIVNVKGGLSAATIIHDIELHDGDVYCAQIGKGNADPLPIGFLAALLHAELERIIVQHDTPITSRWILHEEFDAIL